MNHQYEITLGGAKIVFQLRRSSRRTLAITVQPDMRVVATTPQKVALETVLVKVQKRAGWIGMQQRCFSEFLPQTSPRRYLSGETHRYLGRQYRLKVVEATAADVKMLGRFIWVYTPRKADTGRVRKLVHDWYLAHVKQQLPRRFTESVARLGGAADGSAPDAHPPDEQALGQLDPARRGVAEPRVGDRPSLVHDYVVTHELCHAMHGNHSMKFYDLLRRVMPDCVARKSRREKASNG